MRIAYDAKRFFSNYTGLGNYSRNLIQSCATYSPDNQYQLFASKINQNPQTDFAFQTDCISIIQPKRSKLFWRSIGINKDVNREKSQLFHGLSAEIPYQLNIPATVTIHDLIFESHPKQYSFFDRKIYSAKAKYACKYAEKIIAISKATKQDIIDFYNIADENIEVIYQSCDEQFYQTITEEQIDTLKLNYQLPAHFLLHVGTVIPRKNLKLIVEAIHLLRSKGDEFHLVVVGDTSYAYAQEIIQWIKQQKLESQIHFIKSIPFSDLPALYKASDLFIYPSDYEGFGIPIIEAQAVGVPVITSNKSCLPEAAGPHSICLEELNAETMASAILQLHYNVEQQTEMVRKGKEYIKQFDARLLTNQLMNHYQSLL